MIALDLVALASTLWLFRRRGVPPTVTLVAGVGAVVWLGLLALLLNGTWLPASAGPVAFLAAVATAVAAVGLLLSSPPGRRAVGRLRAEDLLNLQGVRLAFGATFFVQGLMGVLPQTFGILDGLTHMTAGGLGLVAGSLSARGLEPTLPWIANLFGLLDIVVVLASLSFVLIPATGLQHPMMYAVFLPAPFWAWWHVLSLARLIRERTTNPPRILSWIP